MNPEFFLAPGRTGSRVTPVAPPASIVEDGRIHMGLFTEPVRDMNLHAARLFNRVRGFVPVPPLFIEWIGAGLAHPEWYFGMIIVDAKVLSLAVFYGFHRKTGAYFSHDRIGLPGRARVASSAWNGVTAFTGLGFRSSVAHDLATGRHEFEIDVRRFGKRPAVKGKLTWHEPLGKTQPLVLLSPVGENGFIYNHRAQMPLAGELQVGGERVQFDPARDVGNLDEVKIRPEGSRLSYHWFNFGGFDARGRVVGADFALTPQKPDAWWSENCLWVGDKLWMCDEVSFTKNANDLMQPWRAQDERGNIDLTFQPEGGKKVSLGPLGAYHQKCGRFSGRIVDGAGEAHDIRDYQGCAEHAVVSLAKS